jgi:serine/threonine protein kinase
MERIHESGFVHLDIFPSDILWRYDEQGGVGWGWGGGVSILVIDWDSVHERGKRMIPWPEHKKSDQGRQEISGRISWKLQQNGTLHTSTSSRTTSALWRMVIPSVDEIQISMQELQMQTNIEEKTAGEGDRGGKCQEGENSEEGELKVSK